MIIHTQLLLSIVNLDRCEHFILLTFKFLCNYYYLFFYGSLSIFYCFYFKLNEKTQPNKTILIIEPHNHIHLYINNTLNVYLTNQMLEQSLIFLLFS